jgi:hypothetical protein
MAVDSMGASSATSSVQLTIVNAGPVMSIVTPASGSAVFLNQPFTVSGSGLDFSGNDINAATLKWEYQRTGIATSTINTGVNTFNQTFTSLGWHTISLTGSDTTGVASRTSTMVYVNATPTIRIDSPASGTRFDLDHPITFTPTALDPDSSDILNVRWWRENGGSAVQFGTGTTYISQNGDLPAGNRQIVCEVVDRFGVASHSLVNVLVNTLPVATISYSTVPFTTGPGNRPIFLSDQPSMSIDFVAQTFDQEIGGTIESYDRTNSRWFMSYNGVESQIGEGATITAPLELGISTITLLVYDNFYPAFAEQASRSTSLCLQVWQERTYDLTNASHLGLSVTTAADITGTNSGVGANLIFSLQNPNHVITTKFNGAFGADYFSDQVKFDTASATMPAAFTDTYASALVGGKTTSLGNSGGIILKEFDSFDAVGRTYNTFAADLTGARSMTTDNTRLFISYPSLNRISIVNPANGEVTNTLTAANTVNFSNPVKIRYSDQNYGKVFVADKGNNRIVRFSSELLGTALQPFTVTSPEDVAFSTSYVLTINKSTGVVSVIDPLKVQTVMTFGDAVRFNNPVALYCSGYDLFVLEANRLKVIRSGALDWLK